MPLGPRLTDEQLMSLTVADGIDLYFCGGCPNGHLVLMLHKRPIIQMVISAPKLEDMAKRIRANDPNFREIKSDA